MSFPFVYLEPISDIGCCKIVTQQKLQQQGKQNICAYHDKGMPAAKKSPALCV